MNDKTSESAPTEPSGAANSSAGLDADTSLDQRSTLPMTDSNDLIGASFGPYRLLSVLGRGGMGVVYLADQREPVRRNVAIKIIKLGLDSSEVIARFESERQALAVMSHPCIARIYDGGVLPTASGRGGAPFFAMEYVKGDPLTVHCDKHQLTIEERLELYCRICDAVQHAHQKGVIHRDLKPSNILVAFEGDQAVPKIIDFGVAKALNQRLTERTLFTEQGQLIGTPEYMSPEQAEMTGQDIDTRSDVYSLGVILYELLTGQLPLDSESIRRAGFAEIQRLIREFEPPKPSTKLANTRLSQSDKATTVATSRHTQYDHLLSRIRGDLDWIVMKCLEKSSTRRYATVDALRDDIVRHIQNEPILARPPSFSYRLGKIIKRRRGLAVTAFILLIGTAVGVGGLIFGITSSRRAAENEKTARLDAEEQRKHVILANERFLRRILSQFKTSRLVNDPDFEGRETVFAWFEKYEEKIASFKIQDEIEFARIARQITERKKSLSYSHRQLLYKWERPFHDGYLIINNGITSGVSFVKACRQSQLDREVAEIAECAQLLLEIIESKRTWLPPEYKEYQVFQKDLDSREGEVRAIRGETETGKKMMQDAITELGRLRLPQSDDPKTPTMGISREFMLVMAITRLVGFAEFEQDRNAMEFARTALKDNFGVTRLADLEQDDTLGEPPPRSVLQRPIVPKPTKE